MKKVLSIMLSAVMAVCALTVSALPAMAEDVHSPTATTATEKKPNLQVNGSTTQTDITYEIDKDNPNVITFTYAGDGDITGWESNFDALGFVEDVDYTIIENEDGTYSIVLISDDALDAWNNGDITVNAVVDFSEEEPSTETTTKASGTATTASTAKTTTKANGSATSPNTGVATSTVAGTVAVAGVAIAVLSVLKKRDAE